MKLDLESLDQLMTVVDHGPDYDVEKLREDTIKDPKWVAFGTGNIFRAYIARINQDLINLGLEDRGIIAVDSMGSSTLERIYWPNDNLALSVTLDKDGKFNTNLIANIAESIDMSTNIERVEEIFKNPNLQIASFTITEKGYNIFDSQGNIAESIKKQLKEHPSKASALMITSVHLLYTRFKEGLPITMLSIDNLSKNGDVLKRSILTIAEEYVNSGKFEKEFLEYLNDESKVSFPWSMIDKITPQPADVVADYLETKGIQEIRPIKRDKSAPVARFVNSEEAEYLAIEDKFANGRPKFEDVGVYIVDKETVDKIETMKVTACLNPLHTSLAVYGCLLGYDKIYEEMRDEELVNLVTKLAYDEALPVVESPGVIDPNEFVKEVLEVRFPNPYMPDAPQRIATDTSQKVAIRYGKTLSTYVDNGKDVSKLIYIPLSIAGWLRYLLAKDDNGEDMDLSPDPMLEELQTKLQGIELGNFKRTQGLEDILRNEKIFGVNLEEIGLSNKIIGYFEELSQGQGAVRKTLEKYTK